MNGNIFYFSGTGNSLMIAKDLSKELACKLYAINDSLSDEIINSTKGYFGLIFPVYHATYGRSGIPNIVRSFLEKVNDLRKNTVFVICAHSGIPGFTIDNIKAIIESKNGTLFIGRSVQMSSPFSTLAKIGHMITKKPLITNIETETKRRELLFLKWYSLKNVVLDNLINNIREIETISLQKKLLLKLLFSSQTKMVICRYQYLANSTEIDMEILFHKTDNNFKTNTMCIKCGTCVKICPVSNISLDETVKWHNKCELCFACYQWCPKNAIMGDVFEFEKHFHNQNITINEMLRKNLTTAST